MKRTLSCLILAALFIFTTDVLIAQENQQFGPGVYETLERSIDLRNICVPNPKTEYEYDFDISFEKNVNKAIERERKAFKTDEIKKYSHPKYYKNPTEYAQKIINALRTAYSGAYDINVTNIPLDAAVVNASQNHSCKMVSCNEFGHQSSCLGSVKSRVSEQVGEWGSCFNGYSENIAINTLTSVEKAIEWAIFGMMYADVDCCNNGHRENFLKCTYNEDWVMGFGYKKGKYSFGGSGRSYDAWFMTWDYVKKNNGSDCKWDNNNGTKECPEVLVSKFKSLTLDGNSSCTSINIKWSMVRENNSSQFGVYISEDGSSYTLLENITAAGNDENTSYQSIYSPSGDGVKEISVFIKSKDKNGSFISSELKTLNLESCQSKDEEKAQPSTPEPTPPAQEEDEAEEEVVDETQIIIAPNPADDYISLKNIRYGVFYRIYNSSGRPVKYGIYTSEINISRLSSGNYYINADGKNGKFVIQ